MYELHVCSQQNVSIFYAGRTYDKIISKPIYQEYDIGNLMISMNTVSSPNFFF